MIPPDPRRLPVQARYDEEIAEADRQAGRLIDALQPVASSTLVVAAADHGEAFGEHGEIGHSIFVYDTTLRVPLIIAGPGVPGGRAIDDRVALIDVAPTVVRLLGLTPFDADGIDLGPSFTGASAPGREISTRSRSRRCSISDGARCTPSDRESGNTSKRRRPELYDIDARSVMKSGI